MVPNNSNKANHIHRFMYIDKFMSKRSIKEDCVVSFLSISCFMRQQLISYSMLVIYNVVSKLQNW